MRNSLIILKKYNIFLVKKYNTKSYEINPLNGEKFELQFFMFNIFRKDFFCFLVNDTYLGKYYLFIKKSEAPKIKLELFLEETFKHSLYFFLNYDGRKLYNFYFPLKLYKDKEILTLPDFKSIETFFLDFRFEVIIKMNEWIKEIIQRADAKDEFFSFCENYSRENYDEVRLLWEIL